VDSAATHPPHKKIAQKLELPLQYSSTGLAAAHSSPATSSRQDTGRELTDPELEKVILITESVNSVNLSVCDIN
jgi:hypothetical protein